MLVADAAQPTTTRPSFWSLELLDNRYPSLHGLRVLAILSIVQYHVTWIFAGEQGIALHRGFAEAMLSIFFGMDLFFILSGFLIGSILLRSIDLHGTQNIRRFYVRRIFRTFPSYYVVLTVLAVAMSLTVMQKRHLIYEYLYLTNFLSMHRPQLIMFWGWSLALEEQFYLTVPALFFLLHRLTTDRARFAVLGLLWVAALLIRLGIYFHGRPWLDPILYGAVYFRTYTRFDTLVAGILLAFVHQRHGAAVERWLADPFHRALVALPSMACLWLLLRPAMFGEDSVQLVHMFAWGTVTSVMYFGALLLLLHGGGGGIRRALSVPAFRRLATLGYGVYLVHIPILDHVIVPIAHVLDRRRISMALVWPGAFAALLFASFAVAYAMHIFIEKPALRARDRLAG